MAPKSGSESRSPTKMEEEEEEECSSVGCVSCDCPCKLCCPVLQSFCLSFGFLVQFSLPYSSEIVSFTLDLPLKCVNSRKFLALVVLYSVAISSTSGVVSLLSTRLRRKWDALSKSRAEEEEGFEQRLKGPLPADDPGLLRYVREKYLTPPSTKPYRLEKDSGNPKYLHYSRYRKVVISWLHLDDVIKTLFKDEPPGFFVEAGAFDGEYLSNTLDLEFFNGWKGLLVEADDGLVSRMKKKNRKAWISNSCLATLPYPHQVGRILDSTTLVKFVNHLKEPKKLALAIRGFNALIDTKDLNDRLKVAGYPLFGKVQCFPLETLLRAINVTHVNFISLDVEGVEMDILKHFLGGNITVDVWIVEHKHPEELDGLNERVHLEFIQWFQSKGYTLYTYGPPVPTDYTFIRNGSDIYEKAFKSRPARFVRDY